MCQQQDIYTQVGILQSLPV